MITPPQGSAKRAVIYLRVGRHEAPPGGLRELGLGDVQSPARYQAHAVQEIVCQRAAKHLGATVISVYSDFNTSAGDPTRSGYRQLLARLERTPKIGYVIVATQDRLVPQDHHQATVRALLLRNGALLTTASEVIGTNDRPQSTKGEENDDYLTAARRAA